MPSTATTRAVAAFGADVVGILVFVAAGRRSHDEGTGVGGVIEVAAPFLIALVVGWLALRAWRHPRRIVVGAALVPIVIAVGMVLRRTAFDRGTAASFVVVATIVVAALLVGWRAVAGVATRASVAAER
jgi:hypothetical protein